MSNSSLNIQIAAIASKLLADIGDIGGLSPLKPVGNILVTVFEHAAAVGGNKDVLITLVERIDCVVRILINRTRDLDSALPENYLEAIARFERDLVKIAHTLENLHTTVREDDSAILGQGGCLPAGQLVLGLEPCDTICGGTLTSLQRRLHLCTVRIDPQAIRSERMLNMNDNYSVQVATYPNPGSNWERVVVIKQYFPGREKRFNQDLKQILNKIHPNIPVVLGIGNPMIMMLCAKDLVLSGPDIDIDSIRPPWEQRRIGPPIPLSDDDPQDSCSTSASDASKLVLTPSDMLTVKESDEMHQQIISVAKFPEKMEIDVTWWLFKPSWAGLRHDNQIVLIDWAQDTNARFNTEFEPRYAIHIMGLAFSKDVPGPFHDSGRGLIQQENDASTEAQRPHLPDYAWAGSDAKAVHVVEELKKQPPGIPLVPPIFPFGHRRKREHSGMEVQEWPSGTKRKCYGIMGLHPDQLLRFP